MAWGNADHSCPKDSEMWKCERHKASIWPQHIETIINWGIIIFRITHTHTQGKHWCFDLFRTAGQERIAQLWRTVCTEAPGQRWFSWQDWMAIQLQHLSINPTNHTWTILQRLPQQVLGSIIWYRMCFFSVQKPRYSHWWSRWTRISMRKEEDLVHQTLGWTSESLSNELFNVKPTGDFDTTRIFGMFIIVSSYFNIVSMRM